MPIAFQPLNIEAKSTIQRFTLTDRRHNCDLSFTNLCSWQFLYNTQYAVVDEMLLIRYESQGNPFYMMPLGGGDLKAAILALHDDAAAQGKPLRIQGLDRQSFEEVERLFPNVFQWRVKREYSDYVYLRSDLATLSGKKYQPKRNHINQFMRAYPSYEYLPITKELVPDCLKLEWLWEQINLDSNEEAVLEAERRSLTFALNHFSELDLIGGALRVDGQIVAFTFGAAINADTFDVCIEKANVDYIGSYSMINNQFAANLPEQFVYLNREEDLGIEGLRKAKMSYQPYELLDKYTGKWAE